MSKIRDIMNEEETLENISLLEQDVDIDLQEFKEAILEGTYQMNIILRKNN